MGLSRFYGLEQKPVSILGDRLEEFRGLRAVVQHRTQYPHGVRQVALFHERVGPEDLHQFLFRDGPTAVFYQYVEEFKGLGRDPDTVAVLFQDSFIRFEDEIAESYGAGELRHRYL